MKWEYTGTNMPDGRPIWSCPACKRRIWGHVVAPHACRGAEPEPITAANTPCPHRGTVYTSIKVGCCRKTVYTCGIDDIKYCSIAQPGLKIGDIGVSVCASCPIRLGST